MTHIAGSLLIATGAAMFVMRSRGSIESLNALATKQISNWGISSLLRRHREVERLRRLDLELVDSLGEMVMGLEAGLSFEAVLDAYSAGRPSILAIELRTILDDVRVGTSRLQSLVEFERRNPTPSVRLFVSAVQQNSKLGAPLAATLRSQAEAARRQRRQAVEENAAKISLKMVFPTVFCILPVLMVVIVGPAVIRLVESLPK